MLSPQQNPHYIWHKGQGLCNRILKSDYVNKIDFNRQDKYIVDSGHFYKKVGPMPSFLIHIGT